MKYDFTSVPDRSGCGSSKWDAVPGASTEKVPLSTADMEFPTAPAIVSALHELLDTTILGYTNPTARYFDAVCGWMKRRHNYDVSPEEIITTPGVVYALAMLVEALSQPGDSVLILTPVYYPFDMCVMARDRNIVYSDLLLDEQGYSISFEEVDRLTARADVKLLLLCNPHNPIGRVWTREELERIVEICHKNDVFIIDDEIHNDLIMPGCEHTVLASLSEQARQLCAVCTAPSKTFNLAGLQCSNIIIANPEARAKAQAVNTCNMMSHLNIFAYRACETAYNCCEDWLDELITVINGNAHYIRDYMAQYFPEVRVFPLQGTYLLWLDMRQLGMTHVELEQLMQEDAGLYLDEGYIFGDGGRGFERINLACSRVTLERSMERFRLAMERRRQKWTAEGKPYHKTLAAGDALEGFVYDTPSQTGMDLAHSIQKPTILVFSRSLGCSFCQETLNRLERSFPAVEDAGYDLKAVVQSSRDSAARASYSFELICDPDAVLYDRYNVFEAVTALATVSRDKQLLESLGGSREILVASRRGSAAAPEGRSRQLPAAFLIDPDMTVRYAYYGRSIHDLPDLAELLNLKK